ncbi:MAG: isoprenylcysteine carboxylmethyltransferase family protein [Kiritimatiellia bacterium]
MKARWLISCGNFFFRFRNGLFPLFMLLAALIARPLLPMGSERANNITDLVGAAITLTGQFVRCFTIGFKYIKRGGKNKQVYADDLVVGGIFAHSRNPMYVGNLLIFLGVTVVVHSPLLYAVGIPLIGFIYAAIIAAEENFLRGKFGAQFDDYCARVPRLIPNLAGIRSSLAGHAFQWRRVLLKEFGTLTASLVGLVAIRMWSLHLILGAKAGPEIHAWAWAFLPIGLFYITIYTLKKTRRLTESPSPAVPG